MFGGRLVTNYIHSFNYQNSLLAVWNNQLYVFDTNQTNIVKKVTLSDDLIKTWIFIESNQKIIALDQSGSLIQASFSSNKKNQQNWYQNFAISSNKKITKGYIADARIVITSQLQSTFSVYFIQDSNLYTYQNGSKHLLSKQSLKILFASQNHIISSKPKPNSIKINIINNTKSAQQITYEHSSIITSCVVYQQNLILGDQKGKIYQIRNYFNTKKANQQISTKYQWHVHKINGLFLFQDYLYSCGQEGTVVMWHLRQNKKDFLPRIGTQILNVYVIEGIVYCLLKDNSIRAIDLSNDKLLKQYKTIVNPFGFETKGINQNSVNVKYFVFASSESNNRNLLVASGLPGSLQIINLNDGSNNEIQVLPRNLISRLDNYYPQPHDISNVNFNKQWTLMCCSTKGINHNYLHFYKNEGYNLEYTLISRVQNPHEGMVKILSYNNIFVTYAQNEKTIRFWSRVRRAKKSIIQKQEEYFVCSGQITYRQKLIKNCQILADENLLLVNFQDQIIFIDLKKRSIQMAFKGKNQIQQAYIVKKSKNMLSVVLVNKNKITLHDLNRGSKSLQNARTIYTYQNPNHDKTLIKTSLAGNLAILVNYISDNQQIIFEYDLNKNIIFNSFINDNFNDIEILSVSYQNNKLLAFSCDSSLINLTNSEEIIKLSGKTIALTSIHGMQTQEDSNVHFEHQTFQSLNKNFIERQNVRKKAEISQCLQKIQLQMYPSLGFSFSALCQKMFI